jgi:hypothetical protein
MHIDKSDRKALSEYITGEYCGKRLKEIRLYVTNYQYPFENKQGWHLCDSAIEMEFDDESFFTFCFDPAWEVLDFFDKPYLEVNPESRSKVFSQTKHGLWSPFLNNTLDAIDIHWNWYKDFEDNTYFIPQVMKFEFNDNRKFMLAAVQVGVDQGAIVLELDSEGEIIMGFTEEIWEILTTEILRLE